MHLFPWISSRISK